MDGGLGEDDAVASADLAPAAGQLALAIAEEPSGWLQVRVVGTAGSGALDGRVLPVALLDRCQERRAVVERRDVVDVDDDGAGPAGMQRDAVAGAGVPGDDLVRVT